MFKNEVPVNNYTTHIIIKINGYKVVSFRGDHIMGQINCDLIKSSKTSYDTISKVKTIILEV